MPKHCDTIGNFFKESNQNLIPTRTSHLANPIKNLILCLSETPLADGKKNINLNQKSTENSTLFSQETLPAENPIK